MSNDAQRPTEEETDSRVENGISRRTFLTTGAAAGAATVIGGGAALAAPGGASGPPPRVGPGAHDGDLVFVNGKIHTMDGSGSVVSSVAIRDGRFADVGRGVGAGASGARVINLHGRTVIPGIIDNHNHIVLMGNRPGFHTPLENASSIAEVQATLAARASGVPAGSFITTIGGFHFNQFVESRLPNLAELDEALPDHPVYITQSFAGPSTTNSLGKAFFEARGIPVGADGAIAGGFGPSPTGQATFALRSELLTPATRRRGAVDAMAYGAGLGVTTHLDQGAFQTTNSASDGAAHEDNFTMHLPFLELYQNERLGTRLRINFLHRDTDPSVPELSERLKNQFPFFGGEMVRTGGIGEFIAQDVSTAPGSTFVEAARLVAQNRWRAEVHSLSRTDFQAEIEVFEAVNAEFDISALRWVVAHVPFITSDYVARLAAIGGGLSLTSWRYLAGTPASNGPPFRMIVDSGINAGMSSDGMQIAPMNPWLHMYYAVTGVNSAGILINDGQQISREEVLRLYTADNGWFLGEEDDLGTIETGKLADLVVLDRDYFSVSDDEIKDVSSVLTVVGGRIVHDSGVVG